MPPSSELLLPGLSLTQHLLTWSVPSSSQHGQQTPSQTEAHSQSPAPNNSWPANPHFYNPHPRWAVCTPQQSVQLQFIGNYCLVHCPYKPVLPQPPLVGGFEVCTGKAERKARKASCFSTPWRSSSRKCAVHPTPPLALQRAQRGPTCFLKPSHSTKREQFWFLLPQQTVSKWCYGSAISTAHLQSHLTQLTAVPLWQQGEGAEICELRLGDCCWGHKGEAHTPWTHLIILIITSWPQTSCFPVRQR